MRLAAHPPSLSLRVRAALALSPIAVVACSAGAPAPAPTATPSTAPPFPSPATTTQGVDGPGYEEAAVDRSVAPCDDFYAHACGGWLAATPIPADKASWGRGFSVLAERNAETLRGILERAAAGQVDADNPHARAMGDLYASCMDEDAVEARGLGELKDELARVAAVTDATSMAKAMAHQHLLGIAPVFVLDSETDQRDPKTVVGSLRQAGLTLPDRDYYVHDDAKSKAMRAKLLAHVEAMFALAGETASEARAHAEVVVRVETRLAQPQMPRVEMRDPDHIYHPLDRAGLARTAPGFPWDAYFAELGYPGAGVVNVWQPDYVKAAAEMLKTVPMADWRTYLRWNLLHDAAPALGRRFVDENFRLQQLTTGAKTLEPRWRRCVRVVDGAMGEALGRSFAKTMLGADGKAAVEGMVDGLLAAMHEDVEAVAWMDRPTRDRALAKLGTFTKKIGYPDRWRSYDALRVDRGSYLGNAWRAAAFEVKRQRDKMGKPRRPRRVGDDAAHGERLVRAGVQRHRLPGRHPPAAVLRPRAPTRRSNFGAIGMVMGHELTHGFDDEGRKFDADGNLRDWWTPGDGDRVRRPRAVRRRRSTTASRPSTTSTSTAS